MIQLRRFTVMALLLLPIASGCGAGDMAQVHGQVTYAGLPVTSGALIFSPIPAEEQPQPGKSSTGDIQSDGTFQLSTHRLHDGAFVGPHRVRFMRSMENDDEKVASATPAATNYANLTLPDDFVVEVKPGGDNEINLELVKRAPR